VAAFPGLAVVATTDTDPAGLMAAVVMAGRFEEEVDMALRREDMGVEAKA